MQKIFYNGKIYNGENDGFCDAILVNDGAIVFSGSNNEVLDLKNDETEVFDLNQKYVYPTFFACNVNLFNMIEERLKAQNKIDISKNSADNDENYEKFTHFDKYKKEFLNLQKLFIKNGITTIQEVKINRREFTFWKKIAELNLLKIDIAAYVDLISSKQVMDDNCVTYRKYKNHFRLGGYYIKIDGDLFDGKAWLSKPYKHTKFSGFGELYGEQLY